MFAALGFTGLVVVAAVLFGLGLLVALNAGGLADGVSRRHRSQLERGSPGAYIESPRQARMAGWFIVGLGVFAAALALLTR
jgi:hypothetical protein